MKFTRVATILMVTAMAATPAIAQKKPARPATGASTSASVGATGPKVHTSQARDVTSCSRTVNGGGEAAMGMAVGGLLGSKVGGGNAVIAGSAVGGAVGGEVHKKRRCGPDADIENNAAADPAPVKKRGLGVLRNALGL